MNNIADDEWEWYLGQLISKIILDCKYNNANTILEIAPGFRYKTAYALKNINFNKKLIIVDSSKEVCDYVKEKYKEMLPDAQIIVFNENIEDAIKKIDNIDLLIGNHIIDDIIIYKFITNNYVFDTSIKEKLINCWELLHKSNYELEVEKTFEIFKGVLQKTSHCIISQYKSNVFYKDNNYEYEITKKCFDKIKKLVNEEGFVNSLTNYHPFGDDERYLIPSLLANVQNRNNWIIGDVNEFI